MIGISIFPGLDISLGENLKYLEYAKSLGTEYVFTSLHIPESGQHVMSDFQEIAKRCNTYHIKLIVDISKKYFHQEMLEQFPVYAFRLDFGFSDSEIIALSKSMRYKIQLNASTTTIEYLKILLSSGLDINNVEMSYNYYPRIESGISLDMLRQRNQEFKTLNLNIMAFIPSSYKKRAPLFHGLPTLEKHRNTLPIVSAQELLRNGIDSVCIGDSMASNEELEHLSFITRDVYILPTTLYKGISTQELHIVHQAHTNRMDPPEFCIRSKEAKEYLSESIVPRNTVERPSYSLCIDNQQYLRYEGNLHINKKDFCQDDRVNVVGSVAEAKILVDMMQPGDKFRFLMIE